MPVASATQAAISQLYAQLAESITHGKHEVEEAVLSTHFVDKAKMKLDTFEYDPLTVIVRKIDRDGAALVVHASYVGVRGHNADTVDRWERYGDSWVLVSRR